MVFMEGGKEGGRALIGVRVGKAEDGFQECVLSFHCGFWALNSGHQAFATSAFTCPAISPAMKGFLVLVLVFFFPPFSYKEKKSYCFLSDALLTLLLFQSPQFPAGSI